MSDWRARRSFVTSRLLRDRGGTEDFVAETEIAVLFAPVNLRGQDIDQAELVLFRFTTVPKNGDSRH